MDKDICHTCPTDKQKCLSFESHNNMFQNPFDLVYCNIWRPFSVSSYNRSTFLQLLTIAHISL